MAIGDVRDIRQALDVGSKTNQKLHQWSHGSVRHMLTYKAERLGMQVTLQEESYSSKTCPKCGKRRKSSPDGRTFRCVNKRCLWQGHRDMVGAYNIRAKYRGEFGSPLVVGEMASPTGMRYYPHTCVARLSRKGTFLLPRRETAGLEPVQKVRLTELRESVPMSIPELARAAQVNDQTIRNAESGQRVTARVARAIAEALSQQLGRAIH